jgi:hypothetical protein
MTSEEKQESKNNSKGRRRFPSGMTNKKAKATATTEADPLRG